MRGEREEVLGDTCECDMMCCQLVAAAPLCRSPPGRLLKVPPLLGTALPRADSKWFWPRNFLETANKTRIILFTKLEAISFQQHYAEKIDFEYLSL